MLEGLEQLALERSALAGLKRSDPGKIAVAPLIRARTAVANEWIARELARGHVTSVRRYCSDKFKHSDLPGFTSITPGFALMERRRA